MVKASAAGTTLKSGGDFLQNGKYHVICETAEVVHGDAEWNAGEQQVKVKMIAYAPDTAKGGVRIDTLPAEGNNKDGSPATGRLWQFAVAVGVRTLAEYEDSRDNNKEYEIDETQFPGLQCLLEVTGKDKKYATYYSLDDPKAKDFPRSKELLDMLEDHGAGGGQAEGDAGKGAPTGGGGTNGGTNGGGAAKSAATAGAAAGGSDEFDPSL
jgi:hypothetical protein